MFIPQIGTFAAHPGAIKAQHALYLDEDRIHMLFKKFEVLTPCLRNDRIDINWHNPDLPFYIDEPAILTSIKLNPDRSLIKRAADSLYLPDAALDFPRYVPAASAFCGYCEK